MDRDALARRRTSYETEGITVAGCDPDPVRQFERWFAGHQETGPVEPGAMQVATASAAGRPSVRTVLLRGVDDDGGLVWFTNYASAKGRDLAENPWAEAHFVWLALHRQVRASGPVEVLDPVRSDEYFAGRPRPSQLGSAVSPQSSVIADRAALDALVADLERRLAGSEVPRPSHWGGYRIVPDRWEFWQGRPDRLHDRIRYRRDDGGDWVRERLAP